VLEVRTWRFCGCELVNLIDLMNLESLDSLLSIGRERIPFYR